MAPLFLYIIKSTCCLILFYLGYKALLSNETFFRFNRGVLLIGISACLLLPCVQIRTASPGLLQRPLLQLEEVIAEEIGTVPGKTTLLPAPASVQPTAGLSVPWGTILVNLYFAGIGIGFCLLAASCLSLLCLIRKGKRIKKDGYTLILMGRTITPFNWGPYVVLSEKEYQESPNEILTHELVHFRKRHSLDLLFAETVILLHWFNPAVWLLKRELQEIHEFQADIGVLLSGIDATKYQLLLVKKAVSASSYTFANSFNHSKIKKRITMMLKEKSNSWARLKLVLLVPVAACTLLAFARPDVSRKLEQLVVNEGTDFSAPDKAQLQEFFNKEVDQFIEQAGGKATMTLKEKHALLKQKTNVVSLLINANGKILFNDQFVKNEDLPATLAALLAVRSASDKPIAIYFLDDAGTPTGITEEAFTALKYAFEAYQATPDGKNNPTLVFCEDRRNFGTALIDIQTDPNAANIIVMVIHNKETCQSFSVKPDVSRSELDSKVKSLKSDQLLSATIILPSGTKMGIITDIKGALQERYDLKYHRVNYKE